MKIFIRIILSGFFTLILLSCSEDTINENGLGTITGTVVKSGDNTPLENVKISTTPASTTVFSNVDGEFVLNDVPTGQYSVQAEKDDYITGFEAATVSDGVTSNIVFELEISTANNRPPTIPDLVFPMDNETGLDLIVEFKWSSMDPENDPISYSLELRNSSNDNILVFEELQDTTYTVENLRLGETYFWQVEATDDINPPVMSNISSFTTINESSNRFYYVKRIGSNHVIYSGSDQGDNPDHNEFKLTASDKNSFRPRKNSTINKIAFLRTDASETHLYTMNTDGSEVTKLTTSITVAGFRQEELDFSWYQDGGRIYYPHFNRLYSVNSTGVNNLLVYTLPNDIFITEIDTNEFNDLIVIKTNDAFGYNARIVIIDPSGVEQAVVIEGEPGALGGVDFSIDGSKVLYTRDVSGFENANYRQLDSRIFEYDINTDTTVEINTGKPVGTNDLDAKYSPDNGAIIFMNTSNDGVSQKNVFKTIHDGQDNRELIFTDAFMPDWQ